MPLPGLVTGWLCPQGLTLDPNDYGKDNASEDRWYILEVIQRCPYCLGKGRQSAQ